MPPVAHPTIMSNVAIPPQYFTSPSEAVAPEQLPERRLAREDKNPLPHAVKQPAARGKEDDEPVIEGDGISGSTRLRYDSSRGSSPALVIRRCLHSAPYSALVAARVKLRLGNREATVALK